MTASPTTPTKYVLILEDDDDCRFLYGESVRLAGLEAKDFANADTALASIREESLPYSLVLIDLTLPGMDPKSFLHRFRSYPAYRKTPVVVLSGRHDIKEQADALDADAYLRKPCELDPLLDLVSRLTAVTQPA